MRHVRWIPVDGKRNGNLKVEARMIEGIITLQVGSRTKSPA